MDFFVGLFCWTFLLDFFVGLFCWTFLLDFSVGLFCWTILLDYFIGLFQWTILFCKCIADRPTDSQALLLEMLSHLKNISVFRESQHTSASPTPAPCAPSVPSTPCSRSPGTELGDGVDFHACAVCLEIF